MKKAFLLAATLLFFVLTQLPALEQDFERFLEIQDLYQKQEYEQALEAYRNFTRDYPRSSLLPNIYYYMAISHYRLGQYSKAREHFSFLRDYHKNQEFTPFLPFWIGMSDYQLGSFEKAITNLQTFTERSPGEENMSVQARYYILLSHLSLGQPEKARETLATALADYSKAELLHEATIIFLDHLLGEERYSFLLEHLDAFDTTEFSEDQKAKIHLYEAEAYRALDQPKKARSIYETLLEKPPSVSVVAYQRLYSFAQENDNQQRMEEILLAVEQTFAGKPDILQEFWMRGGLESFKREEYDLAEYFLMRVWEVRDSVAILPEVPLTLAEIYITSGRTAEAKELLKEYIELSEEPVPQVQFKLGAILLSENKYPKARNYFEATRVVPESPDLLREKSTYYLAFTHLRLEDYEKALDTASSLLQDYPDGVYHQQVMDIKVNALRQLGELVETEQSLREYLRAYPDNPGRWVDLEEILAEQENYAQVLTTSATVEKRFPRLRSSRPELFLTHSYLTGIAAYTEKRYEEASRALEPIVTGSAYPPSEEKDAATRSIMPWAGYYYSFSMYQLQEYQKAAQVLARVTERYPEHELYQQSLFLHGLCLFEQEEYTQAAELFSEIRREPRELFLKARYQEGRSLEEAGRDQQALSLYSDLYRHQGQTFIADDAMLRYAIVLGETGARDEAVIAYREFPERFPQSPLKDDALFDLGMLYYNNGQYTRAKEVYKEYERLYPDGEYTDRTLYYAGWSARRSGEPTEAILLWEKLIRNYRNSSLRPATLIRTAELYLSRGDYEKSLELYLTFSEDYPEQKEEYGIEKKISETRFLIGGDTREEAELKSIIRNNNRADTRKGREAMIELARLYLFEREGEEQAAYTLLQEVRETAASSDLLAQTAFLLGEFHAVQEQYQQATEWFLQAEEHGAEQKQQASRALYRAAEMQRLLGEKDRVRELVERIQNRYPQTEWAEEARDLLEGLQ